MNRVYVAGKFEDTERVRSAQAKLRELGFEVTHDWTGDDPGTRTGSELEEFLRECALKDYEGVLHADIVVCLNNPKCFGAMVEIGLALAWGKVVYLAGPQLRENIFWHLPEEVGMRTFPTDQAAVQAAHDDLVGAPEAIVETRRCDICGTDITVPQTSDTTECSECVEGSA